MTKKENDKKQFKASCKIIYTRTKDAVETGDKESLFLDEEKVKKLTGTFCKRVRKSEFRVIALDAIDIIILERLFLHREFDKYFLHRYGIESFKELFIPYGVIAKEEVCRRVDNYIQCGLVEHQTGTYPNTGITWEKFVPTQKLLQMASIQMKDWDEKKHNWCIEQDLRIQASYREVDISG